MPTDFERSVRRTEIIAVLLLIGALAEAAWITRPGSLLEIRKRIAEADDRAAVCHLQLDLHPNLHASDLEVCLPPLFADTYLTTTE